MTAIYSVLHMLVDGLCALAMFGVFLTQENGYFYVLLYNFCAFALQMPIGALLDSIVEKSGKFACGRDSAERLSEETREAGSQERKHKQTDWTFLTAAAGVLCTIGGAAVHPALLGVGNALFHVGGGVGCIRQDAAENWQGRGLGIFVAPGALGLYLGTWLAQLGHWKLWYGIIGMGMAVLCAAAYGMSRSAAGNHGIWAHSSGKKAIIGDVEDKNLTVDDIRYAEDKNRTAEEAGEGEREGIGEKVEERGKKKTGEKARILRLWICCLLVVIFRSYIGMAVTFPWKTEALGGVMAVLALVFGKIAGGFWAARYGAGKAAFVSLSLAAIGYLFSSAMPFGLTAVFLFNVTMPITLYWMVCSMPRMPGFAFGFLTFALFLGFLPGYFGMLPQAGGNLVGCGGCVVTLLLLTLGAGRKAYRENLGCSEVKREVRRGSLG